MSRGFKVSESSTRTKSFAPSASELKSLGMTKSEFSQKVSDRVGIASAMAREQERIEAEKSGTLSSLPNDRDNPNSPLGMQSQESRIRNLDYEQAVFYDKYNRLISITDGKENSANIEYANKDQLVGATITHNHPQVTANLSPSDIKSLIIYRYGTLRAVGKKYGDTGEIRYTKEGDPPKLDNKEALAWDEKIGEMWLDTIEQEGQKMLTQLSPAERKVMREEWRHGQINLSYVSSPEAKRIVEDKIKPALEAKFRERVAPELKKLGYTYIYNGKEV